MSENGSFLRFSVIGVLYGCERILLNISTGIKNDTVNHDK